MTALGALALQPAVTVMKLMAAQQQPKPSTDAAAYGIANGISTAARTKQASDDYYFGTGMTVTKLMFALMGKVIDYLNDRLDAGRSGDPQEAEAGEQWRAEALLKDAPAGSRDDFTIPEPGENGITFRQAAKVIEDRFNMDNLARDRDLSRLLENFLGFHLFGADASDIVDAFADPSGKAAHRLRDALEEGLAGAEGDKVAQRLDRVADGPQTVAEVLTDRGSAADTVDEETAAENSQALDAARMNERLGEVQATQDRIARTVENGGDAIDTALGIIGELAQEAQPSGDAAPAGTIPLDSETNDAAEPADNAAAPEETDAAVRSLQGRIEAENGLKSAYAALAGSYADDGQDRDARDRLLFAI